MEAEALLSAVAHMAGKEILTKTHRELTSPKSLHVPTHLISKTRSYEEGALDYVFFIDEKKKKLRLMGIELPELSQLNRARL